MLDMIISGVVLAGISAVGAMAYRHPTAFRTTFGPTVWMLIAVGFGMTMIWNFAVTTTLTTLLPFIPPDRMERADDLAAALEVPDWVSMLAICLLVYVGLLAELPKLLNFEADNDRGPTWH